MFVVRLAFKWWNQFIRFIFILLIYHLDSGKYEQRARIIQATCGNTRCLIIGFLADNIQFCFSFFYSGYLKISILTLPMNWTVIFVLSTASSANNRICSTFLLYRCVHYVCYWFYLYFFFPLPRIRDWSSFNGLAWLSDRRLWH